MGRGARVGYLGTAVLLGTAGYGLAQVQGVRSEAEAFSTRGELLDIPVLVTGDTRSNGFDDGEDFAQEPNFSSSFSDMVEGEILNLAPLAVVNGGLSSISGIADGVNSTSNATAGAATADVIPPILPGVGDSLLEAATRDAQVSITCEGFTTESGLDLLVINGQPIEIPGSDELVILSDDLPLVVANGETVDRFDVDPNDGDECGITVSKTALRVQVADPLIEGPLLDLRLTGASATLDNLPCGCAVIGPTTPTPTPSVTVTPTPTPTQTGGAGGTGGTAGAGGTAGSGGAGGAGGSAGSGGSGGSGGAGGSAGAGGQGGAIPTGTPTRRLETRGGGGCSIGADATGGAGWPVVGVLALLVWRGLLGGGTGRDPRERD